MTGEHQDLAKGMVKDYQEGASVAGIVLRMMDAIDLTTSNRQDPTDNMHLAMSEVWNLHKAEEDSVNELFKLSQAYAFMMTSAWTMDGLMADHGRGKIMAILPQVRNKIMMQALALDMGRSLRGRG